MPAFALKVQAPAESQELAALAAGLEEPTSPSGRSRRQFLGDLSKMMTVLTSLDTQLGTLAKVLAPPSAPSPPAWQPYRWVLASLLGDFGMGPDVNFALASAMAELLEADPHALSFKSDDLLELFQKELETHLQQGQFFAQQATTDVGRAELARRMREGLGTLMTGVREKVALLERANPRSTNRSAFVGWLQQAQKLTATFETLSDQQIVEWLQAVACEDLQEQRATVARLRTLWPVVEAASQQAALPPANQNVGAGLPTPRPPKVKPQIEGKLVKVEEPPQPHLPDRAAPSRGRSELLRVLLDWMPVPGAQDALPVWRQRIHALQGPGLVSSAEEAARRLRTLLRDYHFAQQVALWEAFVRAVPSVMDDPYRAAWLTSTLETLAALSEMQDPPSSEPIQEALVLLRAATPATATGLEEPAEGQTRQEFLKTLATLAQLSTRLGNLATALAPPPSLTPPAWAPYQGALPLAINELGEAAGESRELIWDLALSREAGKVGIRLDPRVSAESLADTLSTDTFSETEHAVTAHMQWTEVLQHRLAAPDRRDTLIQQLRQTVGAEISRLESDKMQQSYKATMGREGWPLPEYRALAEMLDTLTASQIAQGLGWAAGEHLRNLQTVIGDLRVAAALPYAQARLTRQALARAEWKAPTAAAISRAVGNFRVANILNFRRLEGSVVGFYVEGEGLRFARPLALAIAQVPTGVATLAGVVSMEADKAALVASLAAVPAAQTLVVDGIATLEQIPDARDAREEAFRRLHSRGATYSHMITADHDEAPVAYLQQLLAQLGVTLPPDLEYPDQLDPAVHAAALTLLRSVGLEEAPQGEGMTRRDFLGQLVAIAKLAPQLGALADALSPARVASAPAWTSYKPILLKAAGNESLLWLIDQSTQTVKLLAPALNDPARASGPTPMGLPTPADLVTGIHAAAQMALDKGRVLQQQVATAEGRTALFQELEEEWKSGMVKWLDEMVAEGAEGVTDFGRDREWYAAIDRRHVELLNQFQAMRDALTDEQIAAGLQWATAMRLREIQQAITQWQTALASALGPDWTQRFRLPDLLKQGRSGLLTVLLDWMPPRLGDEPLTDWQQRVRASPGEGLVSPVEESARRLRTLLRNYHFAQRVALWEAFVRAIPSVVGDPYRVVWLTDTLETLAALSEMQDPPDEAPIQQALALLRAAGPSTEPLDAGMEEGGAEKSPKPAGQTRREFLKTVAALSKLSTRLDTLADLLAPWAKSSSVSAWGVHRETLRGVARQLVFSNEDPENWYHMSVAGASAALAHLGQFRPMTTQQVMVFEAGMATGFAEALEEGHQEAQRFLERTRTPEQRTALLQEFRTRWQAPDHPESATFVKRYETGQRFLKMFEALPEAAVVEGLRWAVSERVRTLQGAAQRTATLAETLQTLQTLVIPSSSVTLPGRGHEKGDAPVMARPQPSDRIRQSIPGVLRQLRERGASLTAEQAQAILSAQAAGANDVLLIPRSAPSPGATVTLHVPGELQSALAERVAHWPAWPSVEAPVSFDVQTLPSEGQSPAGTVPGPVLPLAVAVRLVSQPRVAGMPNLVVDSPEALDRVTAALVATVAHTALPPTDQDLPIVAVLPLTIDGREVLALFL